MRRRFTLYLTVVLMGNAACTPQYFRLPPPVSEETRAGFGTIGVVSARAVPAPVKPGGALQSAAPEAAVGATAAAGAVATSSGPVAAGGLVGVPYVAIPLAIVAVVTLPLAIQRAAGALPPEKATRLEALLGNAIAEVKTQQALRNQVFRIASAQTGRNLVLVEGEGTGPSDEQAARARLAAGGVSTILELGVLSIGFQSARGEDPLLALWVAASVRVLRVSDGLIQYQSALAYGGARRRYSEWIKDDGRIFRSELERAYQSLAEKTVEEIFLLYDFPLNPAPTWWPK